jgi:hypothetical protein
MKMPLTKAELQRMNDFIEIVDLWLTRREKKIAEGTYYDDDDEASCNPLNAPPGEPFYSDSPPERIHGKPDQELWPPKPRVPVPIEIL